MNRIKEQTGETLKFPDGPPNLTKDAVFDDSEWMMVNSWNASLKHKEFDELDLPNIDNKQFFKWFRSKYNGGGAVPFRVWDELIKRSNKIGVDDEPLLLPPQVAYICVIVSLILLGIVIGWLLHG